MYPTVKPTLTSSIEGKILSIEHKSETETTLLFKNKSDKTLRVDFPNALPEDEVKNKKFEYKLGRAGSGNDIHLLIVGGKHYLGYTKTKEILNQGDK